MEFHTKIHEALFIKKSISSLNRLLYVNGSSFLLSLFYGLKKPKTFKNKKNYDFSCTAEYRYNMVEEYLSSQNFCTE